MMCTKIMINSIMNNELRRLNTIKMPAKLKSIIKAGVCEQNGCIFLAEFFKARKHTELTDILEDATGSECFINHLHIDDYISKDVFLTALGFIMEVSNLVINKFPEKHFRFILAQEDALSCNVRFHCRRDGEVWLTEDIDKYKEEGMLVIDF